VEVPGAITPTHPIIYNNGMIRDDDGRKIRLYDDALEILAQLDHQQISMAVASRTSAPDWADELMELFDIKKYFQYFEIYPGSKVSHFRSLQQKTGLKYSDMIFFDDEYRNIEEVSQLGVVSVFVEDGINRPLLNSLIQQ
jgi:magnesium-dependent phosphatase 1